MAAEPTRAAPDSTQRAPPLNLQNDNLTSMPAPVSRDCTIPLVYNLVLWISFNRSRLHALVAHGKDSPIALKLILPSWGQGRFKSDMERAYINAAAVNRSETEPIHQPEDNRCYRQQACYTRLSIAPGYGFSLDKSAISSPWRPVPLFSKMLFK
jgi:hypothetical protein